MQSASKWESGWYFLQMLFARVCLCSRKQMREASMWLVLCVRRGGTLNEGSFNRKLEAFIMKLLITLY